MDGYHWYICRLKISNILNFLFMQEEMMEMQKNQVISFCQTSILNLVFYLSDAFKMMFCYLYLVQNKVLTFSAVSVLLLA